MEDSPMKVRFTMSKTHSSNTFLAILNRMKGSMKSEANTIEGTWTADNLQAVANELARIYSEDIDSILPRAFVVSAIGSDLDKCCSDYGVERNKATYAEVLITIKGIPGSYKQIKLAADDICFLTKDPVEISSFGVADVMAMCVLPGSIGNVLAGTIKKTADYTSGIISVYNPFDATGGFDVESDESLRNRTLEKIRTPATSGNIRHYKEWALEVPGVEKVKVFDLARGNGTVDVVVIADNSSVAPQVLLDEVADYIEARRPVGADVLVCAAEPVKVLVQASVIVKKGYTSDFITAEFAENLKLYCVSVAFQSSSISYMKIIDLLFSCEGVVDIEEYTLNDTKQSLKFTLRQFPVPMLPNITVTEDL